MRNLPSTALLCGVLVLSAPNSPAADGSQPIDTGTYLQGRAVFQTQCAPCHGRTGRGDGEWAEGVETKPRNFRTGLFKFRTTPAGTLPTHADLERTVRQGVSGTMMPAFTKLPNSDLKAVLAYLRSFSPRWEDPTLYADPVPLPEIPAWWTDPHERKQHAEAAKTVFALTCLACHGASGKGDGPAADGLIDAWENPIKPADLTQLHSKSGDSPRDLFRTLALGLDGTPMAAFLDPLGADTLWNLIALIDQMKTP